LQELSKSGIGSFGNLSCAAKVIPGLDAGLVWLAKGAFLSSAKDFVVALAASSDLDEPIGFGFWLSTEPRASSIGLDIVNFLPGMMCQIKCIVGRRV